MSGLLTRPAREEKKPSLAAAELLEREPSADGEEPNQGPRGVLSIPKELWKDETVERLTLFVEQELSLCEAERGPMMEKFARWKTAYLSPLQEGAKSFPFAGASNLTSTIIKEHVHTLAGQLIQTTTAVQPPFILKDLAAEWEPFIDDLERFLTLAAKRDLNYEESNIMAIIEMCILGTAIIEVPYEVDDRSVYRHTADGRKVFKKNIVFHDGPLCKPIPLGAFWIRMHERRASSARWVAKRLLQTEFELRERQAQGKYEDVDGLIEFYKNRWLAEDPVRKAEDFALNQKSILPERFEIFELYLSYDIDEDDRFEELRLYFHRDSRKFIGRQFLPYWSGDRGFVEYFYFPRTDRFYAEGLAEMLEQIQIAVSAIMNRRADNATLANLKMILKRRTLQTLKPGDLLYTGKIIEVNDVFNDVRELQLSEIYPSTINEEQLFRGIAERLSGTNEAAQGAAMPVTRTTASAQLALLQEQRNRIGLTVTLIRSAQSRIAQIAFNHYSQFGTNSKGLLWMGEQGRVVDAIFRLPVRVKELIQAIEVSAPTSLINRQVKRENAIALLNLLTTIHEKFLPFVQHLAPDSLAEVARAMSRSAYYFLSNVLESYDETDPEAVLEGLAVLEKVLPAPEDLGGMADFTRRAESSETIDKLSRLEATLREAEASREGQPGIPPGDKRSRRTAPPERNSGGNAAGILFGGESLFKRQ